MNASTVRDAVPALSHLSRGAHAQQLIKAVRRSAVLQSPARFAAQELLGRVGRIGRHELTGGGVAVLRHRTRDLDVFDEVLVPPCAYEPPPGAADILAGISSPKVIDLGGNIGLFALDAFKRYPSTAVTSVEADPTNLPVLNDCRARNVDADWTIMPVAAGAQAGNVRFGAGDFADSSVLAHGGVEVEMVDVFPLLATADFVKMDIEGSEWPILFDDRFIALTVPVIVMEWHEAGAPVGDLRRIVLDRLAQAGYQTCGDGNHHVGVAWAWRG